jgi:hypothetical protein
MKQTMKFGGRIEGVRETDAGFDIEYRPEDASLSVFKLPKGNVLNTAFVSSSAGRKLEVVKSAKGGQTVQVNINDTNVYKAT